MAERRMFNRKITDSDAFTAMSSASQALYFHLCQGADDDGFNNQIQTAMFRAHAGKDDLNVLLMKRFIFKFDSGVIVVKHWRLHNTLRKDRYTPTVFLQEFSTLKLKENSVYTEKKTSEHRNESPVESFSGVGWLPNGCQEVATEENSIVDIIIEDRKKENGKEKVEASPSDPLPSDATGIHSSERFKKEKYGEYENVLLTEEEYLKLVSLFPNDYHKRIERLSEYMASTGKRYKNHLATIRAWSRRDAEKKHIDADKPKSEYAGFMEQLAAMREEG